MNEFIPLYGSKLSICRKFRFNNVIIQNVDEICVQIVGNHVWRVDVWKSNEIFNVWNVLEIVTIPITKFWSLLWKFGKNSVFLIKTGRNISDARCRTHGHAVILPRRLNVFYCDDGDGGDVGGDDGDGGNDECDGHIDDDITIADDNYIVLMTLDSQK